MAAVTGMALMAVHDRDAQPVLIRQRLVPLQLAVDGMKTGADSGGLHQRHDASHAIGAAERLSQPSPEEAGVGGEFQRIQTPQPGPKQYRHALYNQRGCDARLLAPVPHAGHDAGGKLEDLVGVPD